MRSREASTYRTSGLRGAAELGRMQLHGSCMALKVMLLAQPKLTANQSECGGNTQDYVSETCLVSMNTCLLKLLSRHVANDICSHI